MAVVDVHNIEGKPVAQMELSDEVFNVPVKTHVLHDVVTMQLANRRSAHPKVKHRGDVAGSTRKLYKQKGTGRARRGDIKSPLLRGGGVIFGPDGRTYARLLPKKVRQLALKMAISSKLQEKALVVLNGFDLAEIKTRGFVAALQALRLKSALIVTETKNDTLERSSRNVPAVKVLRSEGLNVYDILKYDTLVLLQPAIKTIEGRLTA
ncbi:MAG: 50S ribosomal protein L4 [Desulfobacterales bacterium]|jgi:large subunit ribosomal protein L4|nr:50S ribosomal protein L4 [Desulfobacterales bacterium]MCU0604319.1 50S ribosomal protein L4 [Desulfobacterales bacterium]